MYLIVIVLYWVHMAGVNRIATQARREGATLQKAVEADDTFATPELRIVRQVSIDPRATKNNRLLELFLNEYGQQHYGEGITYSLGSMAVSYFTANEMGKMLSYKYPKSYGRGQSVKTRKLVMQIASEFNTFVRDEDTAVTKVLAAIDNSDLEATFTDEQLREGMISFDPSVDLDTTRLNNNKLWQPAHFDVKGIETYRGDCMGLDLVMPSNEALRAEREHIMREFLIKDQKLDTRHIDRDFDPHAVFFRGFRPIAQLALRYYDLADHEILLEKPAAIVNLKR